MSPIVLIVLLAICIIIIFILSEQQSHTFPPILPDDEDEFMYEEDYEEQDEEDEPEDNVEDNEDNEEPEEDDIFIQDPEYVELNVPLADFIEEDEVDKEIQEVEEKK